MIKRIERNFRKIFEDNKPEHFNKDDSMHIEFITDWANLRAYNYGIDFTSEKEAR